MKDSQAPSRRSFLKSTATVAGAAAMQANATLQAAPKDVHAGVDETLKVGLIGCGFRGAAAALDALRVDPQAKLVAVGDVFREPAESCVNRLRRDKTHAAQVVVDDDHIFSDFDNYRQVIDCSDVVLLATPPHFRPLHLEYAVEQGKHAFVEKPVAVDAPGIRRVEAACRLAAEKNLSIVSGLCWRYDVGVRETVRQILEEKRIGEIVAIESSYNANTLWHRGNHPDWSRMEYQLRNWLYYTWLSGDHIAEQAVHSLDKTAWLLGDIQPTKAMALGGRQQRTHEKYGHVFDHFTVFYEYPTGQHVYFTCRQQDGTTTRVDERVLGTNGQAEVLAHRVTPKTGSPWRYTAKKPSMYHQEQDAFFKSIRAGRPINNGQYMCNSNMLAIMGRMAAYTGKTLTWEECYHDNQQLGPTEYAWSDMPEPTVAIPGKSQPGSKNG